MKQAKHRSYQILISDYVALRPRYDRLDYQLLEILCKQIPIISGLVL